MKYSDRISYQQKAPPADWNPPGGAKSKAEALAAQASTWHRGRSKTDGTPFFLVPGSAAGTAHYANVFGCTCEGYRRRGICTHQLACKLLQQCEDDAITAKVKAADAERLARFAALMGTSEDDTCTVGGCTGWATISGGTCREHDGMAVAA